jgi:hypothetical protein
MKTLDHIVQQYLEMKTKYAIIITGDWGSGKTFYYQTTLKELISKTKIESNQQRNYRPISISLFGINSLEDIQSQIILELFPIAKNKKIKLGASVAKAFLKGLMKMNGLSEYYDIVADIDIDKKDWINFEELVIVFDDLERISKTLEIEEVIAFINSLVETQNFKVIIIANEDKIESKDYFKIKEKVIGNSIEFIPNLSDSFDGIIKMFDSFPTYKSFLEFNKQEILLSFKSANLRILSFLLSFFHRIHSSFLAENDIIKVFHNKQNEILLELFKFSTAITIEYKLGKLSYKNRHNLEGFIAVNRISKFLKNNSENEQQSYENDFLKLYYGQEDYKFYNAIYDYITGGDILNFSALKSELFTFYGIENNKPLIQYQILQSLNYRNYFNLSDDEYRLKTKAMIEYAKKGQYPLNEFLTIFHFATRFSNPLKLNLKGLKNDLVKSIESNDYELIPDLDMYLNVNQEAEHPKYLTEIKEASIEKNKLKEEKLYENEAKTMEELLYKNLDVFYSTMFKDYHYKSILDKFDINKFSDYYFHGQNSIKNTISKLLQLRYHNNSDILLHEQNFVVELSKKIKEHLGKNKHKSLSAYMIQNLDETLNILLDKIKNIYT